MERLGEMVEAIKGEFAPEQIAALFGLATPGAKPRRTGKSGFRYPKGLYERNGIFWFKYRLKRNVYPRMSLQTRDYNEALARYYKFKAMLEHGIDPKRKHSLDHIRQRLFRWIDSEDLSEGSKARYRSYITVFWAFLEQQGITDLNDLSVEIVLAYKHHRLTTINMNTLKMEFVALQKYMEILIRLKVIYENAFRDVGRIHSRKSEPIVFQDEDIRKIFSGPLDDDLHDVLLLQFLTGMRSSEVLQLELDDIGADGELLRIRSKPYWELKTQTSERIIPLEGKARDVVLHRCDRARQCGTRFLFLEPADGTELTMKSVRSAIRMKQKRLQDLFRTIKKRMGLDAQLLMKHARSTFKTLLYQLEVDPLTRNRILGHMETTRMDGYYIKTRVEDLRPAMALIEQCWQRIRGR